MLYFSFQLSKNKLGAGHGYSQRYVSVIPAFKRLRKKDHDLQARLSYMEPNKTETEQNKTQHIWDILSMITK
jgi:hypothetical protein